MSRYGGKDGRAAARTIMNTILEDQVCLLFSWAGTNVEASFNSYNEVIDMILTVVRIKHENYTLQELINFLQEHLKHSKARLDRKKSI